MSVTTIFVAASMVNLEIFFIMFWNKSLYLNMILLIIFTILAILLSFFTGFAKAVADLSEEGKIKFKPSRYWIKAMSSPNKWKDGDPRKGEKFFGSSRWFVSLTDAWHVFGFVFRISYGTAFLAIGSLALYNPLLPLLAIPAYALFAGVFHIFHTYKILRK